MSNADNDIESRCKYMLEHVQMLILVIDFAYVMYEIQIWW